MTKLGYALVLMLFAAIAIGGGFAVAPTGRELAPIRTMPCEDFLRAPELIERVRLEGCFVSTRHIEPTVGRDDEPVGSASVDISTPGDDTRVVWVTEDDRMRSLALEFVWCAGLEDCWQRYLDRHPEARFIETSVEGTVERASDVPEIASRLETEHEPDMLGISHPSAWDTYVIDDRPETSVRRPVGMLFLLAGLFGILFFMYAQRRWNARRAALTGSGGQPLVF